MRSLGDMMRSETANPRFTLDTNLLVYSVDLDAGVRHELALSIVNNAPEVECRLTLQSLSEFYAAVTRRRLMPAPEAAGQVNDWLSIFPLIAASADAVRAALVDAVASRASYWDALLIATAAAAGCTLILTEDLTDGATLNGVEIHNPFDPAGRLTARTRQLLGL
jgi:predicted nucleic acid-binding protein